MDNEEDFNMKLNSENGVQLITTAQPIANVVPNVNIGFPAVGPDSSTVVCPHCRCRIRTEVRYKSTTKTHLACCFLLWTGCCCCLPYCMNSCKNANHFCPMCSGFIGTYHS